MICMPDCDEVFTTLDLDAVSAAIAAGAEQLEYDFVYAHDAEGRPSVQFKHSKFYDRRKLKWRGVVHEVLHGWKVQPVYLPPSAIRLEHFQKAETNRSGYLRGLALDCFENPDNDRNSHYFGRELYYTGRYRSALRELDRHIDMRGWAQERGQSAVLKGLCWEARGELGAAERCFFEALQIDATRREPWLRLAWAAKHVGDAQRVASYALAALGVLKSTYYADAQADYREVPHKLLYWALWRLGQEEQSRHHFDKALLFAPADPELIRDRVWYYP
jgi:tetratricopeptide (TPR) repeat protein